MKTISQIYTGVVNPYVGKIKDGLKRYPIFSNRITDKPFSLLILPGPARFALVSFRCEVNFQEALEIVCAEITNDQTKQYERIPLLGKKLVFGKLRHILGTVPVEGIRPETGAVRGHTSLDELMGPIVILGDTLKISTGYGNDKFVPVVRRQTHHTKTIDLIDPDNRISSDFTTLFIEG